MGLSKFRIGQLVEQTTEINTDYLFGADDVRGMTITKQIIPTKADVSVADLSKFLVIHPKEFVFSIKWLERIVLFIAGCKQVEMNALE